MGIMVEVTIEYSEFYETGELKKEKVSDKKYETNMFPITRIKLLNQLLFQKVDGLMKDTLLSLTKRK